MNSIRELTNAHERPVSACSMRSSLSDFDTENIAPLRGSQVFKTFSLFSIA